MGRHFDRRINVSQIDQNTNQPTNQPTDRASYRGALSHLTRPHKRPIPVADGWAGAEMRVFTLSNWITTDRPTDQPTNGRTKPLIEMRGRI